MSDSQMISDDIFEKAVLGLDASSSRGKGASGLLCGVAFECEGMCM